MLSLFNAPTVITNIKEIKAIYEKNETQGQQLKEAIQKVEANLSIDTATDELLTKWEQILGIQKLDIDSLEERRFRVKSKVFQKLPYSIRVVRKKLETLCGVGESTLSVDYEKEEVLCQLHYVPTPFYRVIEQYLEDVIPMNLVISIWEYIDSKFKSEVTIGGNLNIVGGFYPRHNIVLHHLDGWWNIDGTIWLGGYQAEQNIDLYPAKLRIHNGIEANISMSGVPSAIQPVQVSLSTKAMEGFRSDLDYLLQVQNSIKQKTEVTQNEALEWRVKQGSQSHVKTKEESRLKNKSTIISQKKVDTIYSCLTKGKINQTTTSNLICEKDLWFLDGTMVTDGSKLLDAEIIKIDLENTF